MGEASDFGQTIQMVNDLKPQIILLDLHMKDEATFTPVDVKSRLNDGSRIRGHIPRERWRNQGIGGKLRRGSIVGQGGTC